MISRFKPARHDMTIGLMAAKLTGGKAATGDVIGFFDCHVAPQMHWEREIMEKVQAIQGVFKGLVERAARSLSLLASPNP